MSHKMLATIYCYNSEYEQANVIYSEITFLKSYCIAYETDKTETH